MTYTILDCYTDEASGLGVPPYLGTYPRYLAGMLAIEKQENIENINYLTIDDLRLNTFYKGEIKPTTKKDKTNIKIYNLTRTTEETSKILKNTDTLFINLGVHVPGKYLSALPGTIKEVTNLTKDLNCKKILTGPATLGTRLEGGKKAEIINTKDFNKIENYNFSFQKLQDFSVKGAQILKQIPDKRVIEIETGRGCKYGKCSFCTESLKNKFCNRQNKDILEEIKAFYRLGARYFRLGKQADFYASEDPIKLLQQIRKICPGIEILHIDNVNPTSVITKKGEEITKAISKYCTSGNVAAFGIESFDPEVIKLNTLNTTPKIAMKAIEIINRYGREQGETGMPKFLPGINIILGLHGETKQTHKCNIEALKEIMNKDLLLRRINVRQVTVMPGTKMEEYGNKSLRKNKKYYWKWRNEIRQNIDYPMLGKILPKNTILKNCHAEIYDGNTTFCRQFGTYPLIIGVKGRLDLKEFYNIKVTDYMLRSVVGEVC